MHIFQGTSIVLFFLETKLCVGDIFFRIFCATLSPPLAGEEQHINSRPLAALSVKAKSGGKKHLVPNPTLLLSSLKEKYTDAAKFCFLDRASIETLTFGFKFNSDSH